MRLTRWLKSSTLASNIESIDEARGRNFAPVWPRHFRRARSDGRHVCGSLSLLSPENFHHLVAEVIDDFHRNAPRRGALST
jgi:hypothetical protein